ncbi:alpha/beta-hydrolase [Microthyrium microscopicum]|uniref:Alpha/beta-hydrolase n=1 Tax=Microthyrium microscopicum TaxID=703497 RepID=A0A6A6UG11_9PEZI|nr:alpha/beta-hydrolase [Microthyrium microscopicum]
MEKESQREERVSMVGLLPSFFHIGLATFIRMFKAPFRGTKGAPTLKRDIAYATVREILSRLSARESQSLTASTQRYLTTFQFRTLSDECRTYEKEAKAIHWIPSTVDLGGGTKGHWLGRSDAKYVMIFFHGGGYIGHATSGHLKYQFSLQKATRDVGNDFSIFSVTYTLAPYKNYPYQLQQAVTVLKYLLDKEQRDPAKVSTTPFHTVVLANISKILLGGDSAGANLVSALLLHLAHPHPLVDRIQLTSNLKGALLISPWISFETKSPAFKDNAESDYLTIAALNRASSTFIGPGNIDEYAEPIRAPPEWWKSVAERVVDEVMIWGGGGEILIDSIRIFANAIAEGFASADVAYIYAGATTNKDMNGGVFRRRIGRERVFYVETPRASHEEQIMNYTLNIKGKTPAATVIEEWVNARL